MLQRIKSTIRDTLVYSLSNIAPKIVGVILLPLYTSKLALGEFGNWDLLDITITILSEIFIFGQASSIILLNNTEEYKEKKNSALFTLTLFVFAICAILVLLTLSAISFFPAMFENRLIEAGYIRLIAYIVLLRVMNSLFLAKVRADEQSIFYTIISILRIILVTCITIYFVAGLDLGITGILYAALIGEIAAIIFLLIKIIPQMKAKFDTAILSVSIKFGLPLVFSSLGFQLLNLSDRYIIKFLLGAEALAPYGLAYRVAGVLNMFLILPFNLSLMPIAYKYFNQKDDKRFFSKLMTYSTFFFLWGFVFLSLFGKEIIMLFAEQPGFYGAYVVVPVILLSYVFSGMRLTASLGMMLTKNTKHLAWITLGSAILNIILNFIFIPLFGIIAAAVDTLVAFVIFYFVTNSLSNKYYKIPYENYKLVVMIILGVVLSSIIYFLPEMNSILEIMIKFVLAAIFPLLLFFFKFYERAELEILLSPVKIFDLIKQTLRGTKKTTDDTEINIK
ncbi:MAG: oligosaccharide flippase family protein [Ignavibacteriales bacterium]|nr:oligosaccharide flippase family protein [Ignavibacteriales bacterium]